MSQIKRPTGNTLNPQFAGSFDFNPTTRVLFGANAIDQLGTLVRKLDCHRALLVTDPGIVKAGYVNFAQRSLDRTGIASFVFAEVEENPTTRYVEMGVEFAQQHQPIDLIIGLGGGSAMDCAKGINFILTNGGKMDDYWGMNKATKPMLPSIGIPTTAGTGSEAQSFALISNETTHQKMACGDLKARFRAVILDPRLIMSVPRSVAAATGIDAISHAIESYVCTRRNAISQMFSREAWRLLASNFPLMLQSPDNLAVCGNMLLGAHLAGAAIENSMLGAAHPCANPLTAHFGITHGVAVGLMLPHVIRFNGETANAEYGELLSLAGISIRPTQNRGERLAQRIEEFMKAWGLPATLREIGVEKNVLPELAREAASQWTAKFNPRPVGEAELLEIYQMAF